MKLKLKLTYLVPIFFYFMHCTTSSSTNPVKKNHLIVVVTEYPVSAKIHRNATGHIIGLDGASPLVFDWLSLRYNFSYSILDINVTTLEDRGPNLPGVISYASRGECDVIVAVIAPSSERLRLIELVHPWIHTLIGFLIPRPEVLQDNIDAIIKPFQFWVWVALLATITTVIIVLSYFVSRFTILKKQVYKNKNNWKLFPDGDTVKRVSIYVYGTILNQGSYFSNKIFKIRLVVGAWLVLNLVLVNVYNGVLISYMTATHRTQPLINSITDVATNPNLHLVVDKGLGVDVTLSASKEKSLYKVLGDKLRAYSKSRCITTQDCIELVKSLPARHVYANGVIGLKTAIRDDYLKTKQCKLSITGSIPYGNQVLYGWGMKKHSSHLENFNRGTLTLRDMGLTRVWEKQFEPNTQPCMNDIQTGSKPKNQNKPLARLTMVNLTGAFVLFVIGSLVSFIAFLLEIFAHSWVLTRKQGSPGAKCVTGDASGTKVTYYN